METDRHDELDRMLDQALASYTAQEPWPGIEERVIARLRPAPRRRWLKWMLPVPALAGLLMMLVLRDRPVTPSIVAPSPKPAVVKPEPVVAKEQPSVIGRVVRKRHKVPAKPTLAKRDVFPTPSRLTAEERALLKLVTSDPEAADEILAAQEQQKRPLVIEPLQIALLPNGG